MKRFSKRQRFAFEWSCHAEGKSPVRGIAASSADDRSVKEHLLVGHDPHVPIGDALHAHDLLRAQLLPDVWPGGSFAFLIVLVRKEKLQVLKQTAGCRGIPRREDISQLGS